VGGEEVVMIVEKHKLPLEEDPTQADNIVRFVDAAGNEFQVDTAKGEKPPLIVRLSSTKMIVSSRVFDKLSREQEKK
jgi:hypothetical protein